MIVYINNIIIYFKSFKVYLYYLEKILLLIQSANLTLKIKKTYIDFKSIEIFSYKMDQFGLANMEQ